MPLVLTRTYRTWQDFDAEFGVGASHPYDICQTGNNHPYTYMELGGKIADHAKNCAQAAPVEMRDSEGRRIQLLRDQVRNLERLISPSGHTIAFKYDGSDRIIEAEDDTGHVRSIPTTPPDTRKLCPTTLTCYIASNTSGLRSFPDASLHGLIERPNQRAIE
jgi:YD repeat-containing protein